MAHEETEEELEVRTENERQIAMMIVDVLWRSKWIRLALEDFEYQRLRFLGLRTMFGLFRNSDHPCIPVLRRKLEDLVLDELAELQTERWDIPKEDKRTVTAEDLFKPNQRSVTSYGRNVREVSLSRDELEVFEKTPQGQAKYEAYCKSKGVDPKNVVELDPI